MNASEAGSDIAKLWDMAARGPVTVESAGKPIAVVMSPEDYTKLNASRKRRQAGCGLHLLSGAGVDVSQLLAIPVDDEFSEYV
jgi:prevent-host-death family protein